MTSGVLRRRRRRISLSDEAYSAVRNMIFRGELPLGTLVSRRGLSEELHIGILPVTEALRRLEYEGLLESWPRVGTRVRIPTWDYVRGSFVVREALEAQAARLFAEKTTCVEIGELLALGSRVDELQDSASNGSADEFLLHETFHRRIAEYSACPMLVEAIDRTSTLMRTWLYATLSGFHHGPEDRHEELIRTFALREPEQADAAMRRHIRLAMHEATRRLDPYFSGQLDFAEMALRARKGKTESAAAIRSEPENT
jgi:GntR family transcriptional regulator, rspAB operon transcriptional repressor